MSEEAATDLFSEATGSEFVEEQPAEVGSEAEIEQPDVDETEGESEVEEESLDEEGEGEETEIEEGEEEEPEEVLLAGKFKSPEALAEAYKELERKHTIEATKNSRMTELVLDKLGKNLKEGDKPAEPQPMSEAEYQEFMQNPRAAITDMIRQVAGEMNVENRTAETEFETFTDVAMAAAQAELSEDQAYAEMSPEAQELIEGIMEEPSIKGYFNALNVQNFKQHGPTVAKDHFMNGLRTVQDIAEGRAARKSIHNAKANADRKAKESYLKKGKAKGTKPPAAPKPKGKGGGEQNYMDTLASLK